MKRILIFNRTFLQISETFIYRQVVALQEEFDLELLAYRFMHEAKFPMSVKGSHTINKKEFFIEPWVNILVRKLFPDRPKYSAFFNYKIRRSIGKRNVDVIHAHYGWNALKILSFAKHEHLPLVVSFHGRDASASLRDEDYRIQLPQLFEYATAIIICSPHMFNTLDLEKWRPKVHLIPYGIDYEYFLPVSSPQDQSKIKILHAGRIVAKKGVPDLIRIFSKAAREFKNIELHVLGEGEELDQCKKLVKETGIEKQVIFHGAQPHTVVKKLMIESDIFVLNSRTDRDGDMEGLPNAVLEAMSCEKAVLSTLHAGIPMAITDMYNGLLVPEEDNEALYNALVKLIGDKPLRSLLGKNARATIIDKFSLEKMNSEIRSVFQKIAYA